MMAAEAARLRIFVWEYVTAGGWRDIAASRSLIAEGRMMLRALVCDLAAIPGIEVLVARDRDCDLGTLPATVEAVAPGELWPSYAQLAGRCDAVWPIAPETDGILEAATRRAERPVLNSRLEAIAIARSKHATVRWLNTHGIAAVPTVFLGETPPPTRHGWVIKPDDGAGSAETYLVWTIPPTPTVPLKPGGGIHFVGAGSRPPHRDRPSPVEGKSKEGGTRTIVQPFLSGSPLSLSMLAQGGAAWLLACNRQHVICAGNIITYRGSAVGGAEERRNVLEPLAARIADALPGLWGYVGIDLVDTADGPVVLEINPRLTTSYVGLRDSIGLNPAALVLDLFHRPLGAPCRLVEPRPVKIMVPSA
jgi:predicted ATP-grasp superfamily ATP-dependent carboligase